MIDVCEEIGIIKNDKTGRKIITLEEWQKDYDFEKTIIYLFNILLEN